MLLAELSKHLALDPTLAALPLKLHCPEKVPNGLKARIPQSEWDEAIRAFLERATVGTLWEAFSTSFDHAIEQQEELAQHASISERLHAAMAKEEVLRDLLQAHKQLVKNLTEKAESTGDLVGAEEAAKSLDLAPATLRYYAEQGIIPCFKMGRNRKYNLKEIRVAMEKAREAGKIPRVTAEARRRILR